MSFKYQYDEYAFQDLTTAKKLAQFVLDLIQRDEMDWGEMLDVIEDACKYVKKTPKNK